MAVWSRLSARHWREARDEVMGYADPTGLASLRHAIADHLRGSRGISCDPEQIFVANGAQQAFDLIGRVLLNRGDPVWFEIRARSALAIVSSPAARRSFRFRSTGRGSSVEEGRRLSPRFRLAFVTPSHQHPTGVEMSLRRRSELLRAASEEDAWIVEDDYDGEFLYDAAPLPTLKSGDTADRVIYVGTFSKSMFPSLRLGFYVAPRSLIATFQRISGAFLHGVPSSLQATLASFMAEGHFATHLRRMRGDLSRTPRGVPGGGREAAGRRSGLQPDRLGFHVVGRFLDERR